MGLDVGLVNDVQAQLGAQLVPASVGSPQGKGVWSVRASHESQQARAQACARLRAEHPRPWHVPKARPDPGPCPNPGAHHRVALG